MAGLVHGGDIYSFQLEHGGTLPLDFSANINPLGMPEGVRQAIERSAPACLSYPDPLCRCLRKAIAGSHGINEEWIFCGNGAAEVLFRLALALRPKSALLPAPTFFEYEASLSVCSCQIKRHFLKKEDGFCVTKRFLKDISGVDAVYLCNPNNPTGLLACSKVITQLLDCCKKEGCYLIVDECFNDFLDEPEKHSLIGALKDNKNLILLRAFTKLYAMPGIRLGYCMCSDTKVIERLYQMGQPWNVSVIAQECGIAALKEDAFTRQTRDYIHQQRHWLREKLEALGFTVYPGEANYLFFENCGIHSLQEKLRENNILIRSCANYPGLSGNYFRCAVKTGRENRELIQVLTKLKEQGAAIHAAYHDNPGRDGG